MAMDIFNFIYELNRATNAFNNYIDALIVPHAGITRAQFVALLFINDLPGITKVELARKLSSSHVAAGRLATSLLKKGYVISTPDVQNPHAQRLRITNTGKNKVKQVKQDFGKHSTSLFSEVKNKLEIDTLTVQLATFTATLLSHE